MKIEREHLLNLLRMLTPGLASRAIIEQSGDFVFESGRVHSFNDEVVCSVDSPIDVTMAVPSGPLLGLLEKMPDKEVEVTLEDSKLLIRGKQRRGTIRVSNDIILPINEVEQPDKWTKMPKDLTEAIRIGGMCSGTDASQAVLTCVHIHPERVESCDNFQLCRYPIKTGVKESVLVRYSSLTPMFSIPMTAIAVTPSWLYFKNDSGLTMGFRRLVEQYPGDDIGEVLSFTGSPAKFPDSAGDVLARCEVFSKENLDANLVTVVLKSGKVSLIGRGPSGWYEERLKAGYSGPDASFSIRPSLLVELMKKADVCQVSDGKLKVETDQMSYVVCTGKAVDSQ